MAMAAGAAVAAAAAAASSSSSSGGVRPFISQLIASSNTLATEAKAPTQLTLDESLEVYRNFRALTRASTLSRDVLSEAMFAVIRAIHGIHLASYGRLRSWSVQAQKSICDFKLLNDNLEKRLSKLEADRLRSRSGKKKKSSKSSKSPESPKSSNAHVAAGAAGFTTMTMAPAAAGAGPVTGIQQSERLPMPSLPGHAPSTATAVSSSAGKISSAEDDDDKTLTSDLFDQFLPFPPSLTTAGQVVPSTAQTSSAIGSLLLPPPVDQFHFAVNSPLTVAGPPSPIAPYDEFLSLGIMSPIAQPEAFPFAQAQTQSS